jgi:N-acetylglucosamine-6-phosphate deacetylase
MLQGRAIRRDGDRLVSPEGTLAGSTLSMSLALANAIEQGGLDLPSAARMAATTPARFLGLSSETGAIGSGMRADLVAMREDFTVTQTWIAGAAQAN